MLKCISFHKLSIDLPYSHGQGGLCKDLFHTIFHRFNTDWVSEAKVLTLEDYARWALVDSHVHKYVNKQTKFLAKTETITPIKECIDKHDFHLFCLPLTSQSINIPVHRYANDFHGRIVSKRNVSRKDQEASNKAIEIIEQYQQEDLKLKVIRHGLKIHKRIN